MDRTEPRKGRRLKALVDGISNRQRADQRGAADGCAQQNAEMRAGVEAEAAADEGAECHQDILDRKIERQKNGDRHVANEEEQKWQMANGKWRKTNI